MNIYSGLDKQVTPLQNNSYIKLRLLLTGLFLTLLFCLNCQAENKNSRKVAPLDKLKQSSEYKKALTSRSGIGKENKKDLYTAKWFEPGTFYGQIFLSEKGYLNLFEWLEAPQSYSLVETEVDKQNEFLKATRSFLNPKSHFIQIDIIVPHPRSFDAIKLGIVPSYQALFPTESEIEERSQIQVDEERSAELVTTKAGPGKIIYTSGAGARIILTVEHYRFNQSAVSFLKSLNLQLFDQRIQS